MLSSICSRRCELCPSANRQENNLNIAGLFAVFVSDYFSCPFMSSGFVSIGIIFALWHFYVFGGGGGRRVVCFVLNVAFIDRLATTKNKKKKTATTTTKLQRKFQNTRIRRTRTIMRRQTLVCLRSSVKIHTQTSQNISNNETKTEANVRLSFTVLMCEVCSNNGNNAQHVHCRGGVPRCADSTQCILIFLFACLLAHVKKSSN